MVHLVISTITGVLLCYYQSTSQVVFLADCRYGYDT